MWACFDLILQYFFPCGTGYFSTNAVIISTNYNNTLQYSGFYWFSLKTSGFNIQAHETYDKSRVSSSSRQHVFGLWEETKATRGNLQKQGEHTNSKKARGYCSQPLRVNIVLLWRGQLRICLSQKTQKCCWLCCISEHHLKL